MIPASRPVRVSDLRAVQLSVSGTKAETKLILGIAPSDLRKLESGEKVLDPAAALSIRLLDIRGESVSPLKRTPTLREFREFVEELDPSWGHQKAKYAILFGRDRTAQNRWFEREDAAASLPLVLRRCMLVIWNTLHDVLPGERRRTLNDIYELQIREHVMNGYDEKLIREKFTRFHPTKPNRKKKKSSEAAGTQLASTTSKREAGAKKKVATTAPAKKAAPKKAGGKRK